VTVRLLNALILALAISHAIAQSPSLSYAVPSAVAPGKTTTVNFFGENLKGATKLWTSFPAKTALATATNSNESGTVTFQIAVPKDVPVGIGAVRLATTNGVTSLLLIMVDDLPSIRSTGTNNTVAAAQAIKGPIAIDGACQETRFDYYKIIARKGERLSIDVVANRLASLLDAVVRLLDGAGNELIYCDDDPAVVADSRFRHTLATAGQYVIELRDMGYQGGPKYRYRLRVGHFPLASSVFPPGARAGTQPKVMLVGPALDGVRPIQLRVPEHQPGNQLALSVKSSGKGSGFVTFATGDLPEFTELEPNDTLEAATKLTVPMVFNGRFFKPRDKDLFEFAATNGQRLVFSGRTRSLGSPCDLTMRLLDATGKQIAEADISGANEGTLTNSFKEDGLYRLVLEELNRQGDPTFVYRVEARSFQRGFDLSVETDKVTASSGGAFELKVTAARREYDGPITLALDGPGDEVTAENNVIAEKKNETTLKVKLSDRFQAGQMEQFRVVGKATIGGAEFSAESSTLPALRKLFPLLRYPPRQLDGLIALGTRGSGAKPEKEQPDKTE